MRFVFCHLTRDVTVVTNVNRGWVIACDSRCNCYDYLYLYPMKILLIYPNHSFQQNHVQFRRATRFVYSRHSAPIQFQPAHVAVFDRMAIGNRNGLALRKSARKRCARTSIFGHKNIHFVHRNIPIAQMKPKIAKNSTIVLSSNSDVNTSLTEIHVNVECVVLNMYFVIYRSKPKHELISYHRKVSLYSLPREVRSHWWCVDSFLFF